MLQRDCLLSVVAVLADQDAELVTPTGVIPYAIPDHWDVMVERTR